MERVYIETTFISYLTARPSRDLIVAGHQQITHDWWDTQRDGYELCASQLVIQEAGDGDPQAAQERLDILANMTVLENFVLSRGDLPAVIDWTAEAMRRDCLLMSAPLSVWRSKRRQSSM